MSMKDEVATQLIKDFKAKITEGDLDAADEIIFQLSRTVPLTPGLAQKVFKLTTDWAFDRFAFATEQKQQYVDNLLSYADGLKEAQKFAEQAAEDLTLLKIERITAATQKTVNSAMTAVNKAKVLLDDIKDGRLDDPAHLDKTKETIEQAINDFQSILAEFEDN